VQQAPLVLELQLGQEQRYDLEEMERLVTEQLRMKLVVPVEVVLEMQEMEGMALEQLE
jgi:hypothetical protein